MTGAVNVSHQIPEFCKWLERKFDLHFRFLTTIKHPCCEMNDHKDLLPNIHVDGLARYYHGKDVHDVLARLEAPHALRIIAHEVVELTWIRDRKRVGPKSRDHLAQDYEIDKEAMRLVNEFTGKLVYDLDDDSDELPTISPDVEEF